MRLKGKSAIITGGASGFGAGIARKFASEGAQVMIVDLNTDAANALAADLNAFAHTADVSQNSNVKAMTAVSYTHLTLPTKA